MIGGSGTTAWLDLRDAALAATRRGWPVVPGTFLGTDRRWHGRQDARGLCPVEDTWRQRPVTDPAQAWEIWTEAPYGVLLVCGRPVTALELPCAMIGLLPARGELVVPIVVTGSEPRFLVLTSPDTDSETTLAPELSLAGVLLHGAGAWVALPPTCTGLVLFQRWWTRPTQGQTRLRPASQVQRDLLAALHDSRFDGDDEE